MVYARIEVLVLEVENLFGDPFSFRDGARGEKTDCW